MSLKQYKLKGLLGWLSAAKTKTWPGQFESSIARHNEITGQTIESTLEKLTAKELQSILTLAALVYSSGYQDARNFAKTLEKSRL